MSKPSHSSEANSIPPVGEVADFGQRLRAVRTARGRTLRDVALNAKVSIAYLSDLERGKLSNPTLDKLRQIAEELGVSVDDLLGSGQEEAGDVSRLERPEALLGLSRTATFREGVRRHAKDLDRPLRELTEEWLDVLAAVRVAGRRPDTTSDYLFIFEAVRRSLAGGHH